MSDDLTALAARVVLAAEYVRFQAHLGDPIAVELALVTLDRQVALMRLDLDDALPPLRRSARVSSMQSRCLTPTSPPAPSQQ